MRMKDMAIDWLSAGKFFRLFQGSITTRSASRSPVGFNRSSDILVRVISSVQYSSALSFTDKLRLRVARTYCGFSLRAHCKRVPVRRLARLVDALQRLFAEIMIALEIIDKRLERDAREPEH